MGLECYYKRFIGNFSQISYPITSLRGKGKNFKWTQECTTNFQQLKKLLINAPMLKIPNLDKEFVVSTNVCNRGIHGVIMQKGQVICYEFMKLTEHKQNCVTHDLDLETIIHDSNMWRHYILGRRFLLMSDHSGLRYLFDQPNLNTKQARWLATLSDYDFEKGYLKGKENRVADALSRKVQLNHFVAVNLYGIYLQD